jgi:Glycosyl transferase family 2
VNEQADERSVLGEPLPLRVGFAGPRGRALLGAAVHAHAAEAGDLDALVLDPGFGGDGLVERARAAGATVIALSDGSAPQHAGADLTVGAPDPGVLAAAPPLDPAVFNPRDFRDGDVAGLACLVTRSGAGFDAGFELIASATHDEPVTILAREDAELPPLPPGSRRAPLGGGPQPAVRRAGERLGVLDHPSFHASEFERAGWIAKLCAAGVPVCAAEISDELGAMLGSELAELLEPLRPRDLADLDRRERASVALRRAALREHSAAARWRQIAAAAGLSVPARPKVSVILSTRRESWLEHGIAQVARQTYEPRELVVCLHGDEFAEGTSDRVRSLYAGDCKVIRVDGELTLGDALNAGVEASSGELVTKMDDDDYYSTEHLWDLVLALEYSGADLVGKGAEFVYLQWVDLTMRRFMGDGESDHPRLAGGAMMARKAPLLKIGGWPSRSRGEDTWIVKNFKSAGRGTYRTHGFGYILNRHGQGHTWNTYVDYFLIQSQREWRGLRFDESAIEP